MNALPTNSETIVPCEACGSEGRVFITMPGEWDPEDRGPCPYCEGTGGEIIATQPIEMEDLDNLGVPLGAPKIRTEYWPKPIPTSQFDWSATTEDYDLGSPIGYGRTEAEAINDLKNQLEGVAR